jgi:hypothetical protein
MERAKSAILRRLEVSGSRFSRASISCWKCFRERDHPSKVFQRHSPLAGKSKTRNIFLGGCQDFVKFDKTGTVNTRQNINFLISLSLHVESDDFNTINGLDDILLVSLNVLTKLNFGEWTYQEEQRTEICQLVWWRTLRGMKQDKNYSVHDCVMWGSWKNEEREWILENEKKRRGIGNGPKESGEIGEFCGCEKGCGWVRILIGGLFFSFIFPDISRVWCRSFFLSQLSALLRT